MFEQLKYFDYLLSNNDEVLQDIKVINFCLKFRACLKMVEIKN